MSLRTVECETEDVRLAAVLNAAKQMAADKPAVLDLVEQALEVARGSRPVVATEEDSATANDDPVTDHGSSGSTRKPDPSPEGGEESDAASGLNENLRAESANEAPTIDDVKAAIEQSIQRCGSRGRFAFAAGYRVVRVRLPDLGKELEYDFRDLQQLPLSDKLRRHLAGTRSGRLPLDEEIDALIKTIPNRVPPANGTYRNRLSKADNQAIDKAVAAWAPEAVASAEAYWQASMAANRAAQRALKALVNADTEASVKHLERAIKYAQHKEGRHFEDALTLLAALTE